MLASSSASRAGRAPLERAKQSAHGKQLVVKINHEIKLCGEEEKDQIDIIDTSRPHNLCNSCSLSTFLCKAEFIMLALETCVTSSAAPV